MYGVFQNSIQSKKKGNNNISSARYTILLGQEDFHLIADTYNYGAAAAISVPPHRLSYFFFLHCLW